MLDARYWMLDGRCQMLVRARNEWIGNGPAIGIWRSGGALVIYWYRFTE
jgi:hypothetical protein